MARASPEVVYLLGTAWGASPERVELLRSTDDGGHFQAVTAHLLEVPERPGATR